MPMPVPRNCAELLSAGLARHHHHRTPDCPSRPKLQIASKLHLGDCNTTDLQSSFRVTGTRSYSRSSRNGHQTKFLPPQPSPSPRSGRPRSAVPILSPEDEGCGSFIPQQPARLLCVGSVSAHGALPYRLESVVSLVAHTSPLIWSPCRRRETNGRIKASRACLP
jgi:hypothetical protein